MTIHNRFKKTEIGVIPEDWEVRGVGDFVEIKHGYAFKGKFFTEIPNDSVLLTPGNFRIGGGFKSDKLKYTTESCPEEYVLKPDDIVVTMTDLSKEGDTLGYSAKIPKSEGIIKYLHNQRIGLLKFKYKKISSDFIYWILRQKKYNHFVVGSATGSTVKHTSPTRIKEYKFAAPSNFKEQEYIAKILSDLDSKIELNHEMNQTLEAIGQALFKHWFIDFEFPNKNGKPYKSSGGKMVDSELGEIPEGWGVRSLYDCAGYINGAAFRNDDFSPDRNGLPIIKIGELKNGITEQTKFTEKVQETKYHITSGDILFSWSGSPDTSIDTFIWAGNDGWLNQHIFKMQYNRIVEKIFVYNLLRYFKPQFIEIARNKQTTGLGHVTGQDLKRLKTDYPPDNILLKFNNVAAPIFMKVYNNLIETQNLMAIRDSLLPRLMSGRIRVDLEAPHA